MGVVKTEWYRLAGLVAFVAWLIFVGSWGLRLRWWVAEAWVAARVWSWLVAWGAVERPVMSSCPGWVCGLAEG